MRSERQHLADVEMAVESPELDWHSSNSEIDSTASSRSRRAKWILMVCIVAAAISAMFILPHVLPSNQGLLTPSVQPRLPAGHYQDAGPDIINTSYEGDIPFEFAKWRGKIIERKLKNGPTWLHIHNENAASVQWVMSGGAGSYNEVLNQQHPYPNGISHLLEHSFFLKMTPEDRLNFVYRNAYTDSRETVFTIATSSERTLAGIDLISKHLFNYQENPATLEEVAAVNSE